MGEPSPEFAIGDREAEALMGAEAEAICGAPYR
jgi:hypothetical protein